MRSSYDIFSAVHLEHISSEPVCGGVAQCGDGTGDIFGQRETTAGITLAWNLPQHRAIGDAREDGIRRNPGGHEFHGELADVRFQGTPGKAPRVAVSNILSLESEGQEDSQLYLFE